MTPTSKPDCRPPPQALLPPLALSSLQAIWLAVVPGQPEWSEITVSYRDPHVSKCTVPQLGAVKVYHTSGDAVEEPQVAEPSLVALAVEPLTVPPMEKATALAQMLFGGAPGGAAVTVICCASQRLVALLPGKASLPESRMAPSQYVPGATLGIVTAGTATLTFCIGA